MTDRSEDKILTREQLRRRVEQWRRAGADVILTNGCFDLLYVGHRYPRAARLAREGRR